MKCTRMVYEKITENTVQLTETVFHSHTAFVSFTLTGKEKGQVNIT